MKRIILALMLAVPLGTGSVHAQSSPTFVFTAIPDQDETRLAERFTRVADLLQKKLGVTVKYLPVKSYPAAVTAFVNGQVQLAWFGGFTGVQARARVQGSEAIAQGAELLACGLDDIAGAFDIVVNATASSLAGGSVPVPGRVLRPGALAYDMMYGPAAEGFLAWARAHGGIARDGLGMLVEQAAESFFVWRGVRPDTAPVLAGLRALLSAGG